MKNSYIRKTIYLLLVSVCIHCNLHSQTTVNSILELKNLITQDDVNAVMTPGVYSINASDAGTSLFPSETLFEFTGSNSTYDFTGVTFRFDTEIFMKYGNIGVVELRLAGENNVIKNLTMEDIGDERPYRTALGIMFDGINNRIEGVHMTVRGSYPYGYGDIFGKGSGYVIKHFKHSAILVRGEKNHLKNCTIIHRAYGHGIFCQGSIDAVIEGCYLEGETRTTDDVLAEEGTGTPADDEDFMAVWGHRLRPGWTFSLQEDGIRAYNQGAHHITGEATNTTNMRVIDCTIKNLRSGVTIGFCDGEKYVENTTAIGTEAGFWVGSGGEVVNSRGDAIYGPLYSIQYQNDSNTNLDLTVIDNENEIHGTHALMFLGGSGHKVSLKSEEENPKDYKILTAGLREGMRFEQAEGETDQYYTASNIMLSNATNHSIIMDETSENSIIQSCSEVTNNGTNNTIYTFENCEDVDPDDLCPKTAELMEAECYDSMSGIKTEDCSEGTLNVGWIDAGDWLKFNNIDLTGIKSVTARTASKYSGGIIEIRLDAVDGDLIGSIPISNTGAWQNWTDSELEISDFSGDTHDVYFVFNGTNSGSLFNVNRISFYKNILSTGANGLVQNIQISPNPMNKNLDIISSKIDLKNANVILYSSNGKKIIETISDKSHKLILNLSELNRGIYFLKIETKEGSLLDKIVKI